MSNAPAVAPATGVTAAPSRGFRIEAMIFIGLFVALAIFVIIGAFEIREPLGNANTLSPRVVPIAVGVLMLVAAIAVLIDQLRGRFGEPDGGEDIDLDSSTSWLTVLILTVSFLSLIVTIPWLGWPLAVMILFFGAAMALGAKSWWMPLIVGLVLGVITQYLFGSLLGLSLPPTGTLTSWIGI